MLKVSISLITALALSSLGSFAVAAGESEYSQGVKEYKNRNYSHAAELFWKSITAGNASPHAWLYMAHSYSAAGNKEKAFESYQQVEKIYAGQPAAKLASAGIRKLGTMPSTKSANSAPTNKPVRHIRPRTTDVEAWRSLPFKERVITFPPNRKFGHPTVTKISEVAISTAIRRLPGHIYKKLEQGGVTVTIAPNIIDKWPDMVKNNSLDTAAENLAKEKGRCYGRDVHIWQNKIAKNSLAVTSARSTSSLVDTLYHELGHAMDNCSGNYSASSDVLKLHKQDVKEMPEGVRSKLDYYSRDGAKGCSEACAELFSELLGSRSKDAAMCANYFKRLRRFMKKQNNL